MMKLVTYKHFSLLVHVLAWGLVLFFPYLISSEEDQYKVGVLPGLYFTLSGIVHIVVFYLNALFLYPRLLNRRYWPLYIAAVVLLVSFSYAVKLQLLTELFPGISPEARTHVLFPSVLVFIASMFYSITVDKIRAEKLRKENEALQLGMELKFLRSQISPHFLFNVMTSLVYLARKKSEQLEPSLLTLSGLMRYMLYDAGSKLALRQEVEYLENYVALQTLRFGRDIRIDCRIELPDELKNDAIEPMLLIPFVENAFKHGTGYTEGPAIDIRLTVNENMLVFAVTNTFDPDDRSKDKNSGIGLANVRSRLTLLYPNRHDLSIETDKNRFRVILTLKPE
jgi:two-component system, LytTR family, sensor kinase